MLSQFMLFDQYLLYLMTADKKTSTRKHSIMGYHYQKQEAMIARHLHHTQSVYPLISMSTAGTDDFVETVVPVTFLQHSEACVTIF